ncbi:hypothetical protein VE00_06093 [Pseudogymnoascus sp. WSF 3629]|nr:hypothetical protein VE00_06093 [Pseudogymnoascus sp. WSF 3629]
MSPGSNSSSATNPDPAASPILEIEAARNCVGRVYNFKPYKKWSLDTRHEVDRDWLYQQHPVVVIHRQSDGHVHIVTITSSINKTIDPRMYMPVSGNHWDATDNRTKVNLASTETSACEMPKAQSYVRLDSRRQVPFEVLHEFHNQNGENYQLSWESATKLRDSVLEAERGFVSLQQQELEYREAEKRVSLAVSSYINRWTSVEQGEKQIRMLRVLQEKVKTLAGVVDECIDQHWLQPQQELERSLAADGRDLQNAVCRQKDCKKEQVLSLSQDEASHKILLEAVEAEAVRRVETEIVIDGMRKGQNCKTGKLSSKQTRTVKRAVKNIIREEGAVEAIGNKVKTTEGKVTTAPDVPLDWKEAESTSTESGYTDKALALLEFGRLALAG